MAHGSTANARVLIVARPGPLRHGLEALLSAIPVIERVDAADDISSAIALLPVSRAALVLLQSGVGAREIGRLVAEIKAHFPGARCAVLVRDTREQRAAGEAGADAILVEGTLAADFVATVEALLQE